MRIKVGETVAILAGKDRYFIDENGQRKVKTGKVLKIFNEKQRIIVEGVNMKTKHHPPSKDQEKGSITKQEGSIHISNVALIDPKTQTPTKIGIRFKKGKKIRYAKKSNNQLDDIV
ncbi:50S ribosomal protein L24 [Candidatus Phytoplasma australiense]|uniref:Large ribosomal subunit protein uL24 n=1 Tax=Phytoplasma australiense TaxID=59748 RepID=RL24_PHYAS|nr:RecName: Full=Large ribosomal subunit protein uL24; AltName: Full=50S ribosomal protein L24 [Candidatus Phytoplasma australiense]CAM11910.1 50S ribosomal protein L24 [Candidatus Phytoplasma australiense]